MAVAQARGDIYVDVANGEDSMQDGSMAHPFDTLAEGLAAADDGETICAADGVYTGAANKNLSFQGKAVTLTSTGALGGVVVDCESDGRGFLFEQGESSNSVLRGFAIRKGRVPAGECGAGIFVQNASPTIENCILEGNLSEFYGAGLCASGSMGLSVRDSTFVSNSYWTTESGFGMPRIGGGAIYAEHCAGLSLSNCVFRENRALGLGGAVRLTNSSGVVASSAFVSNHLALVPGHFQNYGTALHADQTSVEVIDSAFFSNTGEIGAGEDSQGAIWGVGAIRRCTIEGHPRGFDALEIEYSEVRDNTVGGSATLCLSNRFERNGIGIDDPLWVEGSRFIGNNTGVRGARTNGMTVKDCYFASNEFSVSSGGGFYGPTYIPQVMGSEFLDNDLGIEFVGYHGASQSVVACRFLRNKTAVYGTGLSTVDSSLIEDSSHSAIISAGDIYLNHCTILHSSTSALFASESVFQHGGCPDSQKGTIEVDASIVWDMGGPITELETNLVSTCGGSPLYVQTNVMIMRSTVKGGAGQVWFGTGSTNVEPLFISATDLRLQALSPCIDILPGAGPTDYDGHPRPLDGNADGMALCDLGAFERLHPEADSDGDKMHDGDEWRAGTGLTNPNSVLKLISADATESGRAIVWQAAQHKRYWVQATTNLVDGDWYAVHAQPVVETNGDMDTPLMLFDSNAAHSAIAYRILLVE